jgi:hypothetical protein
MGARERFGKTDRYRLQKGGGQARDRHWRRLGRPEGASSRGGGGRRTGGYLSVEQAERDCGLAIDLETGEAGPRALETSGPPRAPRSGHSAPSAGVSTRRAGESPTGSRGRRLLARRFCWLQSSRMSHPLLSGHERAVHDPGVGLGEQGGGPPAARVQPVTLAAWDAADQGAGVYYSGGADAKGPVRPRRAHRLARSAPIKPLLDPRQPLVEPEPRRAHAGAQELSCSVVGASANWCACRIGVDSLMTRTYVRLGQTILGNASRSDC